MEKVCPTCQREFADDVVYCPHDGMKLRSRRQKSDDPMIGRVLDGRWVIEKRIGEGGMGAVYLGHQRSVDRQVAIKTLRAALVESDDFVDRFFREARVATTINHPHCVTIHDFGQSEDGTLYLAMEYLDGAPLTDRIKEGNLTIEEILHIGMQISSALSAAHDANIVHRDLKPDNIFMLDITGGGTFVKVLDFGIAKVLGSDTQMTRTGQVFGTPSYMSPEQCQGHPIDGRSDLYSLGCILYELVGGRPPFQGETPMAVLMAHVVNEVPPLTGLHRDGTPVDPRLERAIMTLLAKDPDQRPSDAASARSLLESIVTTMKVDELSSRTSDLSTVSPGPLPATTTSDIQPPPQNTEELFAEAGIQETSKVWRILAPLALLLLLSFGLLLFLLPKDKLDEEGLEEVTPPVTQALPAEGPPPDDQPDRLLAVEESRSEVSQAIERAADADADADADSPSDAAAAVEAAEEAPEPAETTSRRNRRPPRSERVQRTPEPAPAPTPRPVVQNPAPEPKPAPEPSPPEEEQDDDPLDFFGAD